MTVLCQPIWEPLWAKSLNKSNPYQEDIRCPLDVAVCLQLDTVLTDTKLFSRGLRSGPSYAGCRSACIVAAAAATAAAATAAAAATTTDVTTTSVMVRWSSV